MTDQVVSALDALMARWMANSRRSDFILPTDRQAWPSPCLLTNGQWRPWRRELSGSMDNLATGLELVVHPDLARVYGSWFSANLPCCFKGMAIELVQPWNEEDYLRLQENLIGHVLMLKKLRLPLSFFLATTPSDRHIISLDNATGHVLYETLGQKQRRVISPTLAHFISRLEPWPARRPEADENINA